MKRHTTALSSPAGAAVESAGAWILPLIGPRVLMVMLCLLTVLSGGAVGNGPALAGEPALVQMDFKPPAEIWVGQRVTFRVTLLGAGAFAGSPVFDLPAIPGALIMKIEDRPVIGSQPLDGLEYTTQTHELAVFPQRAGDFLVPSFNVRFGVRPALDQEPGSFTLPTEEIGFKALTPPGADGLGSIISAEKLTVTQNWTPKPPSEAPVGHAYARTVTFRSSDIPGMAFPPLPDLSIPGLGVYPKPAAVRDQVNRGDFTGSRVETVVYVLEQPGTKVIPSLVFHWWDIGRQEMQTIAFPAVTIEAQLSPGVEVNQTPATAPSPASRQWVLFPLVVLAAMIAFFFRFRTGLVRRINRWRTRRGQRESACFSRLIRTCKRHDPAAALDAFFRWMSKVDDGRTSTIAGFIEKHPDQALSRELGELQKAAIKLRTDWTGNNLARELTQARSRMKHPKSDRPPGTLPDLNPPAK